MTAVAEPEILSALDPEQRSAAEAIRGPVCILAGAGTGKTRAITHRIAFAVGTGAVSPAHVLAVTFTARAAGELRGRLRRLGAGAVQARTFHSAALRQLQYFWPRTIGGELPAILKSKVPLLAEVAGRLRLGLSSSDLRDVACEIEWMKALQRPPDDYASSVLLAHRIAPRPVTEITALYAGYEDLKVRKNQFDFEDLLLHATALLETEPAVALQVRDQYRYFVVDEYQDVNPAQQRLLDAWLGDRDDLCVVGDPEQTIYSFAGASPEYLTGFSARYPKATVVRLVRDYRSTPQVVALANRLSGGALVAQLPPGPVPVVDSYADEVAEAAAVATMISRLIADGTPASEIAVLFRINAQSETFEQTLAEAGVPYVLRGGERFFERPEVREAVFLLRGAARGEQPDEGTLADVVRGVLAAVGFGPAPPSGSGVARDRWESLAALVRLAEERVGVESKVGEFAAVTVTAAPDGAITTPDGGRGSSLADFVADLEERASLQHAPVVDGVTLASLHAAKGLEWDAVFLVGLVDGTLPIVYAETTAQVDEERRLLYVGITRARRYLALSWAAARSPGGRASRRPSRFLDDLRPATAGGSVQPGVARSPLAAKSGRDRVERCRVCQKLLTSGAARKLGRCADCPGNVDEVLFERLRAWRLERSKELKQPAFCVFTDATLTRIAEVRPQTTQELATIGGVGPAKLTAYAAEVLELCSESNSGDSSSSVEWIRLPDQRK
ncbi:MAG TPA: ATP-dependent DNA helicase UvrD2 [Acidothermaceae bacterium]|nr:ATP-dependent DNA helicase UvrD2 [Acidothermaceae bacterium]